MAYEYSDTKNEDIAKPMIPITTNGMVLLSTVDL